MARAWRLVPGGLAAALLLLFANSPGQALAGNRASDCRLAPTASADGSFAEAGRDAGRARLANLAALTRLRFVVAARRLCIAGILSPADLAGFGALVVQNGEGATEPLLYREEGMRPRSWIFQYAFEDGGPPGEAAIVQALRCWKRPGGPDCAGD
jgi:hypothetical protein